MILIKDNFFDSVDKIRQIALDFDYNYFEDLIPTPEWRGYRTNSLVLCESNFSSLLVECAKKIIFSVCEFYNLNSDEYVIDIFFHITYERTKETINDFENMKYHRDSASYAGLVYLTPNPQQEMGTSILYKNKIIDVKNVYNRMVAYPAYYIHGPKNLFGDTKENSRMTLTFLTFFITKTT